MWSNFVMNSERYVDDWHFERIYLNVLNFTNKTQQANQKWNKNKLSIILFDFSIIIIFFSSYFNQNPHEIIIKKIKITWNIFSEKLFIKLQTIFVFLSVYFFFFVKWTNKNLTLININNSEEEIANHNTKNKMNKIQFIYYRE